MCKFLNAGEEEAVCSLAEMRKWGRDCISAVSRSSCRVPGLVHFHNYRLGRLCHSWGSEVLFESTGPLPGLWPSKTTLASASVSIGTPLPVMFSSCLWWVCINDWFKLSKWLDAFLFSCFLWCWEKQGSYFSVFWVQRGLNYCSLQRQKKPSLSAPLTEISGPKPASSLCGSKILTCCRWWTWPGPLQVPQTS